MDLDASFYVLKKDLKIKCKPCGTEIAAGGVSRCMGNFQAHLKRPSHHDRVLSYKDKILKQKLQSKENNSVQESDVKKSEKMLKDEEADNRFCAAQKVASCFTFLKSSYKIMCTYCMTHISLFPSRGDFMCNVKAHVDSPSHVTASKKKTKQGSLAGFFKGTK